MYSVLRPSQHIFLDHLRLYHENSVRDLKFFEAHTSEKARCIGLELHRKKKEWSEIFLDKQAEHKFYIIFLISQMTSFKTTNADLLNKQPIFSCHKRPPFSYYANFP